MGSYKFVKIILEFPLFYSAASLLTLLACGCVWTALGLSQSSCSPLQFPSNLQVAHSHRTPSSIWFCVELSRPNGTSARPLMKTSFIQQFPLSWPKITFQRALWIGNPYPLYRKKSIVAALTWVMFLRCLRSPAHHKALPLSTQQKHRKVKEEVCE